MNHIYNFGFLEATLKITTKVKFILKIDTSQYIQNIMSMCFNMKLLSRYFAGIFVY